ncbi:MAG: regulator [Gammaproteobacteria bacterium]|nr:regulator [Gammaproteobacteria bacterium]MDH4253186.1 regulator [Gammaproteobacteria bacterium]MDH5308452.1 regulator [Gammaproteobacteria bacterium]
MSATIRNAAVAAVLLVIAVAAAVLVMRGEKVEEAGAPAADMPAGHPSFSTPDGRPPNGAPPAGGSVAEIDPDAHFTHFRVGQRNVKAILPDGDVVWVGTSAGVIRYDTTNDDYKLFDTRTGLLANGVFDLMKLQGRLAVGTYGGGLAVLNETEDDWRIYNIPDGLGDGFIYDVLELDNGDVWVATWSGANRVLGGRMDDRSSWELYTVANTNGALPNDWVYALRAGKDGDVWFATEGGLAHFKDGVWRNWNHEDGLGADYEVVRDQIEFPIDPAQYSQHHARQKSEMGLDEVTISYNPNYIVALEVDRNGVVWCGTWGGGLARFDGSEWKNYTFADGLPGNHVFMLHEDPDGVLWVGTSNGLARLDGETFTRYTTENGLFSNRIFSMATADDGSYWVGSFGGVARITSLQ